MPGMVDPRCPREPILADDLGIQMKCGTGLSPCSVGDCRPDRGHGNCLPRIGSLQESRKTLLSNHEAFAPRNLRTLLAVLLARGASTLWYFTCSINARSLGST